MGISVNWWTDGFHGRGGEWVKWSGWCMGEMYDHNVHTYQTHYVFITQEYHPVTNIYKIQIFNLANKSVQGRQLTVLTDTIIATIV